MKHEKFHYRSLNDVTMKLDELGVYLPFSKNTRILFDPVQVLGKTLPNRLAIAPMEGNDSDEKGFPTEHTVQRYITYAKGGAAIIWYEAIAVVAEGRSSKHQLVLNEETLSAFQEMNRRVKEAGREANGFEPLLIIQANHSGRYAKPNGYPEPLIAYHHPVYEAENPIDDSRIVTDAYLDGLVEKFGHASLLSREAGFDAVDVKSCHGYLFAEMASAYTRKGRYGGSFENRFRLLLDSIRSAKEYETKDFHVVCRLGIYDGFSFPYGFGMARDGSLTPDYDEAIRLVKIMTEDLGVRLINITMGNPYQNSHVTRPFDMGKYPAPEHPFEGVARIYAGTKTIKDHFPDTLIMASAPSYLRQFSAELAAGAVAKGYCDFVDFGRGSFADPEFPNEIRATGGLDPRHICVTCGKCGDLIRAGYPCGCVVRNSKEFLPYYRDYMEKVKAEEEKAKAEIKIKTAGGK